MACIAPSVDMLANAVSMAPAGTATPLQKMFSCVEAGLSYQYHASWGLVLQIIAAFFDVIGKQCHQIMKKVLAQDL